MKQQQLTVGREAHRGVFQMPVVLENETTPSAASECPVQVPWSPPLVPRS